MAYLWAFSDVHEYVYLRLKKCVSKGEMTMEKESSIDIDKVVATLNYRPWDDIEVSKAPAALNYRKWANITVVAYFMVLATIILGLLISASNANLAGSHKFAMENMEITGLIFLFAIFARILV